LAHLDPADPLYAEAVTRRERGEAVPADAALLLNTTTFHPQEVVRRKELKRYIGLADSATDALIANGELAPFVLRKGGIATGVLAASITAFQLRGILRRAWNMEPGKGRLDHRAAHMRELKAQGAHKAARR
jgi:hypothetical protein